MKVWNIFFLIFLNEIICSGIYGERVPVDITSKPEKLLYVNYYLFMLLFIFQKERDIRPILERNISVSETFNLL